ncbi:hypothetical protein [Marilutibacter chinensis]|uniref:Tetratricopeptide repeat protein n=1 Tax=Marilutibacter chinensis TaxID=2912247 RepID=A0ABS9HUI3_9GAMM|nr:hypothetical protein [Lysobacter chinensis]MCF7221973.1 hypothetical protein [Lysobacter chinensis]
MEKNRNAFPGSGQSGGRRVEPTFDPDRLAAAMRVVDRCPPEDQRPHGPLPAWTWWAASAGVGLVIVALMAFRQPLADRLWPETRAQQLRTEAEQALSEGRLSAADGSGARELYEAALALEPDRLEARAGLARVARQALAQARTAMDAGRYPDAYRALALARELGVPRADADETAERLRERQAAHADVDQWLVSAASALKAGHLSGDERAALPLYRRVLALQPNRTEALEGREDALSALLQHAWSAMRDGDLAAAGRRIEQAREFDAGHAELPDATAELARLVELRHERARAALRRDRLDDARRLWREVLAVDGEDAAARQGLLSVARAQAAQAIREARDFRFETAQAALAEARDTAIDAPAAAPAIAEAERQLRQARQSRQRLQAVGASMTAAEREQRVSRLLRAALAAEQRGDLLQPPGESAFDAVRAARALAPDDARVAEATARLLPASQQCYRDALRDNRLVRAGRCLQAGEVLGVDSDILREQRLRLAQRWIAVGDERLGAGELAVAQAALEAARALDPAAAGLDALARRVETAAVGD